MLCTSEQVSAGHPDKICDQISDAIVTDCLRHDKNSRVAAECLIKNYEIIIAGEITSAHRPDFKALARGVLRRIGLPGVDQYRVTALISQQSPDIALGVDADGAGAPVAKRILEAAAVPIYEQMKANASSDPKIITGVLNRSIQTGKVRKRRYSGRSITIGVHRKEEGAYYAPPVEDGHGGPAPAPAHPYIRPAYDTRSDEAYEIIRDGLRDAIDQL